MHAKSGLRVVLKWMITCSGSVITGVIAHPEAIRNSNGIDR